MRSSCDAAASPIFKSCLCFLISPLDLNYSSCAYVNVCIVLPLGVGWHVAVFLFSFLTKKEEGYDIVGGGLCIKKKKKYASVRSVHLWTGGAPFVCSGAVETRLHVMMTFVPVCLRGYSRALMTHFLSPSFPLARDKEEQEGRGLFWKWHSQIRAGW